MENPPSSGHAAVSASTTRDEDIDICFINKAGRVSLGNSQSYGGETLGPSTKPALPNRSTAGTATGAGGNSNVAGPSRTSTHESQNQTAVTLSTTNSSQSQTSEESPQVSNEVPETSLIPDQILLPEELESYLAQQEPDDSYFTLIWLDRFYEVKADPKSEGKDQAESLDDDPSESAGSGQPAPPSTKKNIKDSSNMDDCYVKVLDSLGLCRHCRDQTKEILWRNITEYESRYESRCRTCEDNGGVCFLQFHTMQAPYLNESNFILVLVHHIKILKVSGGGYADPEEHIFAFVLGLEAKNISTLITSLRMYWEATNPGSEEEVGLTTRLFLTAVLKLYGFREAQDSVLKSFGKLENVGKELKELRKTLKSEVESNKKKEEKAILLTTEGKKKNFTEEEEKKLKDKFEKQMRHCTTLNLKLMKMDKVLPGVRSRVHFVNLCAQGLLRDQSQIQEYVRDYFAALEDKTGEGIAPNTMSEGQLTPGDQVPKLAKTSETGSMRTATNQEGKPATQVIKALSSLHYKRRDDDKMDMLHRSMQQFEIDIKSLKARTNIAIGLVATEYARSQGNFQSLVIEATERDSSIMRVIATLTVLLLPATFLALFFATPMIQWAKPVVKLDSETPGSLKDTGSPIFVIIPLSLWLGLSFFISFFLWAWLHAKREQKKIFPWLIEKVRGIPSQLLQRLQRLSRFRKARTEESVSPSIQKQSPSIFNNKSRSMTSGLEEGEGMRKEVSQSASPPTGTKLKLPGLRPPGRSGPRSSGDSTLVSIPDDGIEHEHIRQPPSGHQ